MEAENIKLEPYLQIDLGVNLAYNIWNKISRSI